MQRTCKHINVIAAGLVATAASLSILAGWRVYLCVVAAGIAMRTGWVAPPDHLVGLQALASPWVIGSAAFGATAEFMADKVPWVDSLWDAVHTAIRPVGGALLALAIVDASDPRWQVVTVVLGGGGALLGHVAKSGSRAVINATPEPFSNIIVSTGEDVTTTGLLALALASPLGAAVVAGVVIIGSTALLLVVRRLLKRVFGAPAQRRDSASR